MAILAPVIALLVLLAVVLPSDVNAHGYMMKPISRSWLAAGQRYSNGHSPDGFYGPMNLNRAGKPYKGATCGGERVGDSRFEVGGKLAKRKITASYKSGGLITTTVQITNNHWGFIQFRLCPLRGTTVAAEKASLSEACFAKHTLKNANWQDKLWLYRGRPGEKYVVTSTWRLPRGIKCPRCVLQWRYVTGHSCYLPGVDKRKMLKLQPGGNRNCPSNYMGLNSLPSEKFWGCADIRIA